MHCQETDRLHVGTSLGHVRGQGDVDDSQGFQYGRRRGLDHLKGLLVPTMRDGMKLLYRVLRRSLGSVFMVSGRAFAFDEVAMKLERPECSEANQSDMQDQV